jgi:hypothetical protein
MSYTETHETVETCAGCGGKLLDTLMTFSEAVPLTFHAEKADLAIALGRSLVVGTAYCVRLFAQERGEQGGE